MSIADNSQYKKIINLSPQNDGETMSVSKIIWWKWVFIITKINDGFTTYIDCVPRKKYNLEWDKVMKQKYGK